MELFAEELYVVDRVQDRLTVGNYQSTGPVLEALALLDEFALQLAENLIDKDVCEFLVALLQVFGGVGG